MKLQVHTVDLELSPKQKKVIRWSVGTGAAIASIGVGVAFAAIAPFKSGEKVSADAMNANFTDLDSRLKALESHDRNKLTARYSMQTFPTIAANGWTALTYDAKAYDSASACAITPEFSFRAPVAGRYMIVAKWQPNGAGAGERGLGFGVNSKTMPTSIGNQLPLPNGAGIVAADIVDLQPNDKVYVLGFSQVGEGTYGDPTKNFVSIAGPL